MYQTVRNMQRACVTTLIFILLKQYEQCRLTQLQKLKGKLLFFLFEIVSLTIKILHTSEFSALNSHGTVLFF